MTCFHCHQEIYKVTQHTGPDVLVHEKTGYVHCSIDWETRSGNVATPMEATAK